MEINVGYKYRCIRPFRTGLGRNTNFEIGCVIEIMLRSENRCSPNYMIKMINAKKEFE